MKNILKALLLLALALTMLASLASCGTKIMETTAYAIELPSSYKKNDASTDATQIYNKGGVSPNIITITCWNHNDIFILCTAQGVENPTPEDLIKTAAASYFGAKEYTPVTIGDYTLYEYDDFLGSVGAYYLYYTETGIWSIDFSVAEKKYEGFKEEIPEILASFRVK